MSTSQQYTVTITIKINAETSTDASNKIEALLAVLLTDEKIYDYLVKSVRRDAEEEA